MTTTSQEQLLRVALRDLREGRRVVARCLPAVASATSDPDTRMSFERLVLRSLKEMDTLASMLIEPEGEPNLWASGIMDDACRDVSTTQAGPVRDIALIGAIRKFVAADIVSIETAIALAQRETDRKSQELHGIRKAMAEEDDQLRSHLFRLTTHQAQGTPHQLA